jgi:hypothetical protein
MSRRERVEVLIEYTGQNGLPCNGGLVNGELVREYQHVVGANNWQVKARLRQPTIEIADHIWQLMSGAVVVSAGPVAAVDGHASRAFVASMSSGQMTARQVLWIDADTLLPLRWLMSQPGTAIGPPISKDTGLTFTMISDTIALPDHVGRPACIQ